MQRGVRDQHGTIWARDEAGKSWQEEVAGHEVHQLARRHLVASLLPADAHTRLQPESFLFPENQTTGAAIGNIELLAPPNVAAAKNGRPGFAAEGEGPLCAEGIFRAAMSMLRASLVGAGV